MFRGCLMVMTLVLLFAAITAPAQAQSGRGRQLRIQGLQSGETVPPEGAENQEVQKTVFGLSRPSTIKIRTNGGLIYNDAAANQKKNDGEYHMTRGDKTAGWILLGATALVTIALLSQD